VTPFTLVMAYYDNPGMLQHHIRVWIGLPQEIRQALHVVVVDDGSPRWPAISAVSQSARVTPGWGDLIADFQLFRMKEDIPWNQDACRNLGVKHAATQWLLLTDIDHVVPLATWRRLMAGKLDKHGVYRFGRVSAPDMQPYKHHPNSWALRAKTFWRCGGYDETLAGNYGTDGDFMVRLRRVAEIQDLPEVLIRYPRDVIPDASTTTLQRKLPEQKANVSRLIAERSTVADWRPLVLSFPFERLL
jgi:hypothetical protein